MEDLAESYTVLCTVNIGFWLKNKMDAVLLFATLVLQLLRACVSPHETAAATG